jgi:hypothetical protein
MQKFRIIGPEDNNPQTQEAIVKCIHLLEQSGNTARTENTAGEPCYPQKDYDEEVEIAELTEEQKQAVKDINLIIENAGSAVFSHIGLPDPRK